MSIEVKVRKRNEEQLTWKTVFDLFANKSYNPVEEIMLYKVRKGHKPKFDVICPEKRTRILMEKTRF